MNGNPADSSRRLPVGPSWLLGYRWRSDLPADFVAGLAIAALLIPESLGYAGVAGVPAQVGLYAAIGSVVAYALTGGVSILVVGPASAVAALSASGRQVSSNPAGSAQVPEENRRPATSDQRLAGAGVTA